MQHTWISVIPGLALMCYLGLYIYVVWRGQPNKQTRAFAAYLLLMAAWSFGALMLRLDSQRAELWWRLVSVAVTLMLLPLLAFVQAFVGAVRPRWLLWAVSAIAALVFVPLHLQRGVITSVAGVSGSQVQYELGPLAYAMGAFEALIFAVALSYLAAEYRKTIDPVKRNRIRYPLLGLTVSCLGLFSNALPSLGAYPIDNASNVVNALLITYAIARYRLLDMRLVLRQVLAVGLIVLIPFLTYLVSLNVTGALVSGSWLGGLIATMVLTALVLAIMPGTLERAQATVDRLFFREHYDARRVLRELSAASLTLRPLDELASMLLEGTASAMDIGKAAFLAPGEPDGPLHMLAQTGYDTPPGEILVQPDHPLVRYLERDNQVLPSSEIPLVPQLKSLRAGERADLQKLQAEAFVGVRDSTGILGIFAFGARRDGTPFSQDDFNVFATLANQTAVAIANARLYQEVSLHLAELRRANEELHQLDRMKDEFIQTVSHELRTPVTFIRGYVDVIMEETLGPVSTEQRSALQTVQKATDGVITLVNDVIMLTRSADANITSGAVDLGAIATMSAVGAGAIAESAGIEMNLAVPHGLPLVMGDPRRLTQVFDNLIGNAIKFSPGGGTITVAAAVEQDIIHCTVADQGIGIPADKLDRVWDRFYQVEQGTARRFGGTGLGLAIVKRIVETHGGRVWAESAAGSGSVFHFTLPAGSNGAQPGSCGPKGNGHSTT